MFQSGYGTGWKKQRMLECFCSSDEKYVRYLYLIQSSFLFCVQLAGKPVTAPEDVMELEEGMSAILTSGTQRQEQAFYAPCRSPG